MADYYSSTSFCVNVKNRDERKKLLNVLITCNHFVDPDPDMEDHISEDPDVLETCLDNMQDFKGHARLEYKLEENSVWFHGDNFNGDLAAAMLSTWLRIYDLSYVISFTVAYTCSKPRIGEFAGGSYVVTKAGYHAYHSDDINAAIESGLKDKRKLSELNEDFRNKLMSEIDNHHPLIKGYILRVMRETDI